MCAGEVSDWVPECGFGADAKDGAREWRPYGTGREINVEVLTQLPRLYTNLRLRVFCEGHYWEGGKKCDGVVEQPKCDLCNRAVRLKHDLSAGEMVPADVTYDPLLSNELYRHTGDHRLFRGGDGQGEGSAVVHKGG